MNQITPVTIDKANFLDWVARQNGRYELVRGQVVKMAGASYVHERLAIRIGSLMEQRLDLDVWAPVPGNFAIDVDPQSYRFPELSVMRIPADGKVRSTNEPVVLVEVASPSTERVDFTDKKAEYLALASLDTYVIVSQDERRLWVWTRANGTFSDEPQELSEDGDVLAIPSIGFSCSVAEIYNRIL